MALPSLDKLLPRERLLLGVCCLAVLLALGNWLVVRRVQARLVELSSNIKNDSTRLEQNYAIIAKKDEVQAKYDGIKAYIPQQPAQQNVKGTDELSTEIEQLAARCGVSLLDRKPQESVRMGPFEKSSVRFEMVGDQDGFTRLLYRTEVSPKLLRISKMDISKNTRAGTFPLKAVMVVTAIAQVPDGP